MEVQMELDMMQNEECTENVTNQTDNAENDGCNKQSGRLFTQSELEALISERMKRERKNARSLNSVKELLNTLKSGGVIKEGSYSDMACQLVEMFSQNSQQDKDAQKANISLVGQDVQQCGEVTKQKEPYTLADENTSENGNASQEQQNMDLVDTVGQPESDFSDDGAKPDVNANALFEFKRLYPDADLNAVFGDEAFFRFAKGKQGELHEIYKDYSEFVEKLKSDSDSYNRRVYSTQGSTAFSSDSKAYTTDYAQRLTRRQMDIANSCGMSYREYGELLSSIPNSPKRNLY